MSISLLFSMTHNNIIASLILGIALLGAAFFISQKPVVVSMDPPIKQLSIDAEGKVKATPDTIIINA